MTLRLVQPVQPMSLLPNSFMTDTKRPCSASTHWMRCVRVGSLLVQAMEGDVPVSVRIDEAEAVSDRQLLHRR
jgi:hypothetical protein